MTTIGLASVRSCGVTTMAVALARCWPAEHRLLVEADPAGGTVAAWAGLAAEPGLVSLATAARRSADPDLVLEHGQPLVDSTVVLCAPPSSERARSALTMADGVLSQLERVEADVVVDCGRLDPAASNLERFESCDLRVLVSRPRLGDLHALATWCEAQEDRLGDLRLLLIGPGPYRVQEIADAVGLDVVGQLPWDPDGAEAVAMLSARSRRFRTMPLVRAVRSLTDGLATRLAELPPQAAEETPIPCSLNGRAESLEVEE